MTPAGIALLVIGILIFAVSFFIPDKGDRESKQDIAKKQEQIRRLMETELDGMKLRVNEATNETVEFGMEKSERALEKITNEKIMAVSEYATTIMEEIDKNHKEVLFLYDMLNDKQTDIKNTVRHAEAAVKEVSDATKTASDTAVYATNVANAANEVAAAASMNFEAYANAQLNANVAQPYQDFKADNVFDNKENDSQSELKFDVNDIAPQESLFSMAADLDSFTPNDIEPVVPVVKEVVEEKAIEEKELTEFEILEKNTTFNNVSNNNQMILKLNAEGVPVVDIARQLSLGVGEVQLVIDLFR